MRRHSHPGATFVAVKSGTVTLSHGDATSRTSKSYSAGQGFLERPGDVQVNRNDGTSPVELYITFLAVPVGAGLRTDEKNPGGRTVLTPTPLTRDPQSSPAQGASGRPGCSPPSGSGSPERAPPPAPLPGAGSPLRLPGRRSPRPPGGHVPREDKLGGRTRLERLVTLPEESSTCPERFDAL